MREKEREKLEFDDLMTRAGNKILQRDKNGKRKRECETEIDI